MPFHLHFGAEDLLRCRFAISPLWEAHEAVRTLARPERHAYHLPWLRHSRGALEGLDLGPLLLLMPLRGYTPDFLGRPPTGTASTFEEELAAVRATDAQQARRDIARSLADTPGATTSATGRALLEDPARAVRELADLTEQVWQLLVAPQWPRLRTLLEADVAFHARRLADGGLEGLFGGLHPRLSWREGTLTLHRDGEHERELGGQGLVLMPSAFAWPEVIGGFDPPWQPTVVYPARGIGGLWNTEGPHTPQALARLLGRARAEVLLALDEPASTTTLARRLRLAPSSVSAHLSALRGAGLLVSGRYGHQVLYERTPLGLALATGEGTG
ncbi:DUF5937 family protein [Streptomyces sp. NPDC006879]|uniref:ArsR/SmtB family transcription factor n=1 Tax=Streptomyces sp. NPDC006879 TaxID=3364767 RepID=UPI0036741128